MQIARLKKQSEKCFFPRGWKHLIKGKNTNADLKILKKDRNGDRPQFPQFMGIAGVSVYFTTHPLSACFLNKSFFIDQAWDFVNHAYTDAWL